MAGEWLKFESNLPDKPETLAITASMGWDDPDLTVGKLMRVFRWFDQQTVDGNARGVTPALLDRVIGVSGFVQAMANARWIVVTEAGLTLQNFDRHNGASAKSRAQTAKRVANHRAEHQPNQQLGERNAHTVTPALAREEKRREEKKEAKASSAQGFAPPEWVPSEQWAAFVQMRKAMRNVPFTDAAAKGVIAELQRLCEAGGGAADLLQAAVTNGWRTVYPPKTNGHSGNKQEALEQRNRAAGAAWLAKERFV